MLTLIAIILLGYGIFLLIDCMEELEERIEELEKKEAQNEISD